MGAGGWVRWSKGAMITHGEFKEPKGPGAEHPCGHWSQDNGRSGRTRPLRSLGEMRRQTPSKSWLLSLYPETLLF